MAARIITAGGIALRRIPFPRQAGRIPGVAMQALCGRAMLPRCAEWAHRPSAWCTTSATNEDTVAGAAAFGDKPLPRRNRAAEHGAGARQWWDVYEEGDSWWNRRLFVPTHLAQPPDWLPALRARALSALDKADEDAYVDTAFEFLHRTGDLDRRDPLYFDPFLLFIGPASPVHTVLVDVLALCFERACIARGTLRGPNNRSGFALCAMKGTGKTVLLNAAAISSTLLLPNFLAVGVDAAYAGTAISTGDKILRPPSPLDLLDAASTARSIDTLQGRPSIDSFLKGAAQQGFATGVFVDEVREWYVNSPDSWRQLHAILQDYQACCFVADSTSVVPHYVRGERAVISRFSEEGPFLPGLNADKMQVLDVPTLSSRAQYKAFFRKRAVLLPDDLHPSDDGKDVIPTDFVDGVHVQTNGRFRAVAASLSAPSRSSLKMPTADSPAVAILRALLHETQQMGHRFDPFAMGSLPESQVIRIMDDYAREHDMQLGMADLNRYVEANWLTKLDAAVTGAERYTFGSPQQFLALEAWSPSLFISHVMEPAQNQGTGGAGVARTSPLIAFYEQLRRQHIGAVMCEDAAHHLAQHTVEGWELVPVDQAFDPRAMSPSCMMVILSDEYLEAAKDASRGAHRELEAAREAVSVENEHDAYLNQQRVLLARFSSDTPSLGSVLAQLPEELRTRRKNPDANAPQRIESAYFPFVYDLDDPKQRRRVATDIMGRASMLYKQQANGGEVPCE